MIVLFAANLVASSARRSRAEEMLNVTPTTDTRRTWAMSLGIALPWPASAPSRRAPWLSSTASTTSRPRTLLTAGELAQLPFILAGAGLLGVLAARWLPFAGGVLITFVARDPGRSRRVPPVRLRHLVDVVVDQRPPSRAVPPVPGEPWLHAAYLAGLCACAAVAAVYRDRTQWPRLALVGGPVLAATLVLGWLQLP